MNMYQHRRDRLQALIDEQYEQKRKNLCQAADIDESRLAQLLSPTFRKGMAFSEKTARKLEEKLGLPPLYFDQGASPSVDDIIASVPGAMRVRAADQDDPALTQIMKVKLKVQAGITGFQVEAEHYEGDTMTVPTSWIEREGYVREALLAIVVKGDSMMDKLHDGDTIIVNTMDKKPVSGQVYVINYEGEAVVKRMVRDAGQWWLTSDNPDQVRYHKQLCKGAECIVIGKVVRKESTYI